MISSFEQIGTMPKLHLRDGAGFCYKEKILPQHKRPETDPSNVHPPTPLFSVLFFMAMD